VQVHIAGAGEVDGEPARIYTYGESHPNLVRVNEPGYHMNDRAYTTNTSIGVLNGWNILKEKDYSIAYARGMKISRDNLANAVKPERLNDISTAYQGLQKLATKRLDLYIDDDSVTTPLLNSNSLELQEIRVAGLMETTPLYMYIHKKHRELAPKLAEVIEDNEAGRTDRKIS
jgi:hypothetical protein